MAAATMSQINARIDSRLKTEGDKAFAQAGLTPTQAIRKLWELAAHHASEPEALVAILNPDEAAREETARDQHRLDVDEAIARGSTLVEDAFSKMGMSPRAQADTRSYDQLRQDAYEATYDGEGEGRA